MCGVRCAVCRVRVQCLTVDECLPEQILIDVPLLDKIYTILGQYEELLEQYIASGRLRRLLNSNRMRRKLEKINSDLHVRRHRLRHSPTSIDSMRWWCPVPK